MSPRSLLCLCLAIGFILLSTSRLLSHRGRQLLDLLHSVRDFFLSPASSVIANKWHISTWNNQSFARQFKRNDNLFVKTEILDTSLHYLRSVTNTQEGKISRVHIVEEQVEAVPLWLRCFLEGGVHGNESFCQLKPGATILVHVDAHSLMNIPSKSHTLHNYEWPTSHQRLLQLMAENDAFLLALFGMGLFSHFIWLIPQWHSGDMDYLAMKIYVGLVRLNHRADEVVCLCSKEGNFMFNTDHKVSQSDWSIHKQSNLSRKSVEGDIAGSNGLICAVFMEHHIETDVPIPPGEGTCQLRYRIQTEFLVIKNSTLCSLNKIMINRNNSSPLQEPFYTDNSGLRALILSSILSSKAHPPHLPYIINIDEDYFGLVDPIVPLQQAQLLSPKFNIHQLNVALGKTFCSFEGADGEVRFHRWFKYDVLERLFGTQWQCWRAYGQQKACQDFNVALPQLVHSWQSNVVHQRNLCYGAEDGIHLPRAKETLFYVWNWLRECSLKQLKALSKLGICMQNSPMMSRIQASAWQISIFNKLNDTHSPENLSAFSLGLCTGMRPLESEASHDVLEEVENVEEDSSTPNQEVVLNRIQELENVLKEFKAIPQLITISRSRRRSHSPIHWHPLIESELKGMFQRLNFVRNISEEILQDQDLWQVAI